MAQATKASVAEIPPRTRLNHQPERVPNRRDHAGAPSTAPLPRRREAVAPERLPRLPSDTEEPLSREALYLEFQPLVRRLLRQYGEDLDFREDLVGEIYCRFCDLYDAFDPSRGVPLRPYLVRTLTASVYTYSRSQWRRKHREVVLDSGTELPDSIQDHSSAWDQKLLTEAVLRSLPDAVARLPQRQRQVVIWRYYESRSFEEIADVLQIRPATARSILRHGLNNLRRWIAPTEL
ncbi:MAG: RNA polymerase sigma factor [Armatimonadota bacterium]